MRYKATSIEYDESLSYHVTDVVVTEPRIAIDWIEDGEPGHMVLNSDDGIRYSELVQ